MLHNAAIGTEAGFLTLVRDPEFSSNAAGASQGTSMFGDMRWKGEDADSFDVEQVDFEEFIKSFEREIDLVKMDIEGAEVAILEKLLESPVLGLIKHLFVETHEAQIPELGPRSEAIRARVKAQGLTKINLDWH